MTTHEKRSDRFPFKNCWKALGPRCNLCMMICQNTSLAALCFIEHSKTDFYCHFLEKCSMLLVHWRCTLLNLVTRLPRWNRSKLVISYHLSDMSWKVIDFCNFLISKHKRMNYKKEVSFTLHLLVEFQNGWDRSHLLPFQSPTNLREGPRGMIFVTSTTSGGN